MRIESTHSNMCSVYPVCAAIGCKAIPDVRIISIFARLITLGNPYYQLSDGVGEYEAIS